MLVALHSGRANHAQNRNRAAATPPSPATTRATQPARAPGPGGARRTFASSSRSRIPSHSARSPPNRCPHRPASAGHVGFAIRVPGVAAAPRPPSERRPRSARRVTASDEHEGRRCRPRPTAQRRARLHRWSRRTARESPPPCLRARGGRRGTGVDIAGDGRDSRRVVTLREGGARSPADASTAHGREPSVHHRPRTSPNGRNGRKPATVLRTLLLR